MIYNFILVQLMVIAFLSYPLHLASIIHTMYLGICECQSYDHFLKLKMLHFTSTDKELLSIIGLYLADFLEGLPLILKMITQHKQNPFHWCGKI